MMLLKRNLNYEVIILVYYNIDEHLQSITRQGLWGTARACKQSARHGKHGTGLGRGGRCGSAVMAEVPAQLRAASYSPAAAEIPAAQQHCRAEKESLPLLDRRRTRSPPAIACAGAAPSSRRARRRPPAAAAIDRSHPHLQAALKRVSTLRAARREARGVKGAAAT